MSRYEYDRIAADHTDKSYHSFPAHVTHKGGKRYELWWGSDFVADIDWLKEGRCRVRTWHDNEYVGLPERVIPLALDDYLELRMAYRPTPPPRQNHLVLEAARAEAARRNQAMFGTDPSWYGQ